MLAAAARKAVLPLLLVLLTAGAHVWELHGEYVFDDVAYVQLNDEVQRGLGADWWRFFTNRGTYSNVASTVHYRPLPALTYAMDASLGWGTFGYKVTQVAIHLGTVLALFAALMLLRRHLPALPRGTPFLAAAWVGVAPFNVQVVHYMAARSSLLCGAFAALVLALHLGMRLQDRPARALGLYAVQLAATGAALLSKETALALPAALFAADLVLLRRGARPVPLGSWRFWWPYLPYAAGLAVALTVMPNANHAVGYLTQVLHSEWRLATAIRCLVENVHLMLLPMGLSAMYPTNEAVRLADPGTLGSLALLLLASAGAWAARRRAPLVTFGWVWYLLLIAPSTFVHLNVILQDHRGYTASFGVGMVLAYLGARLVEAGAIRRRAAIAGLVCVAVLLVAGTVARERVWATGLALWEDAVAHDPEDLGARINRGMARANAQRLGEAEADFRWVLARDPGSSYALYDLAQLLEAEGRHGEALEFAERLLADTPDDPRVLRQVALAYAGEGRYARALDAFHRLAAAETANARTRRYLYRHDPAWTAVEMARVAVRAGRLDEARWAVRYLQDADPGNPQADFLAFQVGMAGADWRGAAAALDRLQARLPGDPRVAAWRAELEAAHEQAAGGGPGERPAGPEAPGAPPGAGGVPR